MPTLSMYVGESEISVLFFESQSRFGFAKYPYVFPHYLIRGNFNEDKFYSQVLKFLKKKLKLTDENYDLVVGNLDGMSVPVNAKNFVSISNAMASLQSYNWMLIEEFAVVTPGNFVSYYPSKEVADFSQSAAFNYLSNKSLYPQTVAVSSENQKYEEILIKSLVSRTEGAGVDGVGQGGRQEAVVTGHPLVFTGSKFSKLSRDPLRMYLMALDSMKTPGFYSVKLDPANKLPAAAVLNHFFVEKANVASDKEAKEAVTFLSPDMLEIGGDNIFDLEFLSVGNVLNSPGGAECLIEMDAGQSQFVEVKADKLLVFPLDKHMSARVVCDSKTAGHIEAKIKGGALGFVVDTRQKDSKDFLTTSSTRNTEWVKALRERLEAA